jgi:hypothetical protein
VFALPWPITGRTSDAPCQTSDGGGGNDALSLKTVYHSARRICCEFRLSPVAFPGAWQTRFANQELLKSYLA